jgi:flagellar biosynthesis protein FliP
MADRAIPAESSVLTEEDLRKRDIVKELMQAQNQRIVDFATHLLTVSFSAIGVVLALKDNWLGTDAPPHQQLLLGIAIALFLATGLLATLAASTYIHRVSLSDYTDVDAELHRVARLRYRLTRLGFGLSVIATIIVAVVAI